MVVRPATMPPADGAGADHSPRREDGRSWPAPWSRRWLPEHSAELRSGLTHRPTLAIPVRFNLDLPASVPLAGTGSEVNLSPDGRTLVYRTSSATGSALARRALDRADATIIPGTEDAIVPAISPDSKWIAFAAGGRSRRCRSTVESHRSLRREAPVSVLGPEGHHRTRGPQPEADVGLGVRR